MGRLLEYFQANTRRVIHKFPAHLEVYERFFPRYLGRNPTVVEIGIDHGGSLQMWREYFGKDARIVGVDIVDRRDLAEDCGAEIFMGNQADRVFLRELSEHLGKIDILIDDGSHNVADQIVTLEELFPRIDPYGLYACEDTHTSYRDLYGGGHKRDGSFVEYCKGIVDRMHADRGDVECEKTLFPNEFTHAAFGLHFYQSLVVIEKIPASAYGGATRTGEVLA